MTTITYRDLMALPILRIGTDRSDLDGGWQPEGEYELWLASQDCATPTKAAINGTRGFDLETMGIQSATIDYPRPTGYVDTAAIRRHMSTQPRPMPLHLRPRRAGIVSRVIRWMQGRGRR